MNLDQIATKYNTTVEQYINGEWVEVEVEEETTTEVEEEETTEVDPTEVFMSETSTITTVKTGPARIIASMRAFGLSVKRIADMVGVSTSAVYRWSRAENWPLDQNLSSLIRAAQSI